MVLTSSSTPSRHQAFMQRSQIWLFSAICFALPMKASFIYTLSALLLLAWALENQLVEKFRNILSSKLCLAFLAYFFAYVIAMLWTEETASGWKMVGRQIPLLLFPLYWSSAKAEHKERYISSFLAGLCVCAVLAYYNLLQSHWFPQWPRGIQVNKSIGDTAPFVDWIMYSPMLALGAYFSLRRVVVANGVGMRVHSLAIFCLLASNLVFSGGRAGMVMFVAMFIALVFERTKARLKAFLICMVAISLAFTAMYSTVGFFATRVNNAVTDLKTFDKNKNTSIGGRFVFWTIGSQIFLQNPILGVGSGDLKKECARITSSATVDSYNPHNQYLMTGGTTGLLGLIPLFLIFYFAYTAGTDKRVKALLFGYAVLCMFESYLWRSNTFLAFSVLLATLTPKQKIEPAS